MTAAVLLSLTHRRRRYSSIRESYAKSFFGHLTNHTVHCIGLMPLPGRLTVMFSSVNISPLDNGSGGDYALAGYFYIRSLPSLPRPSRRCPALFLYGARPLPSRRAQPDRARRGGLVRAVFFVKCKMLFYHLCAKCGGRDRNLDSKCVIAIAHATGVQPAQTVHSFEIHIAVRCRILGCAMQAISDVFCGLCSGFEDIDAVATSSMVDIPVESITLAAGPSDLARR